MFPSSRHHSSLAHRLAMLLLSTGALPPTRYPKRCSKKLPKKISEEVFQKLFNKFANRISEVQIFSQMYFRRPISSKYISEVQILSSKILKAPYPGFLKFRQHGSADRLRVPPRPHGEQPGRRLLAGAGREPGGGRAGLLAGLLAGAGGEPGGSRAGLLAGLLAGAGREPGGSRAGLLAGLLAGAGRV